MEDSKPRILYISSANPLKGPGAIGLNQYLRLKGAGFEIDMMTLYMVEGHPEILYVKKEFTLWDRIKRKYHVLTHTTLPGAPHYFMYRKEINPPVSTKKVLKCISKEYDLLMIYFWEGLLSFQTVDAIYEKLNHPVVFFIAPDYSHMSGGCHFPGICERFQVGCGCCPAFNSKDFNDFTHWNVKYRKQFYEKVQPIVFGNSYVYSIYEKSYLLKDQRIVKRVPYLGPVNPLLNKQSLRDKYKIPEDKKFIVAFGCQELNDPRKGINQLIEALTIWYEELNNSERNQVLLLVTGKFFEIIQNRLPFSAISLGMVPVSQLKEFYSVSDIFVCPSVNDPGPSMVGQSISWGTPVVGFEMGAMLDFVKDKGTGYCAKLKDCKELAYGINLFFRMTIEQREEISENCRRLVRQYSYEARINQLMDLYKKYR